jgi:catechol 2,3-dioxygenase-like lactoylglutathione lyase family enzyme
MIATGPVTQICWVTEDIGETEQYLSAHFEVGRWTRLPDIRFAPEDCVLRGEPANFTVHVSLAYAGDLQLEIIQPVSGASIYAEFLATSKPGLHHLCFEVDDMDAALASAAAAGVEIAQAGSMMGGEMRFAYLDGAHAGVPYIELAQLGPAMRAFYETLK